MYVSDPHFDKVQVLSRETMFLTRSAMSFFSHPPFTIMTLPSGVRTIGVLRADELLELEVFEFWRSRVFGAQSRFCISSSEAMVDPSWPSPSPSQGT